MKHLYRSSNQIPCVDRGVSLLLLTFGAQSAQAQHFDFAAKEAVKLPASALAQLYQYIEKRDGSPMTIGETYVYVPVYNVLNRSQKQFTDGVYMFILNVHDSGQLFINQKGKVVILRNGSVPEILADYSGFLKQNKLPVTTQVSYLSAIAAFMQYQYKDIQEKIKSGALDELRDKP
ncbi:hypothetical protein I7X13_14020 [Hymenobacter sp. BT442]|uniref:Uncharacterized protein n=1 Tax=Hymenobacter negativus TaxID=2795026 RepID=A0ABS0Q922_9BACT|nr:hypothetical protein [Hymenobacter negativus]